MKKKKVEVKVNVKLKKMTDMCITCERNPDNWWFTGSVGSKRCVNCDCDLNTEEIDQFSDDTLSIYDDREDTETHVSLSSIESLPKAVEQTEDSIRLVFPEDSDPEEFGSKEYCRLLLTNYTGTVIIDREEAVAPRVDRHAEPVHATIEQLLEDYDSVDANRKYWERVEEAERKVRSLMLMSKRGFDTCYVDSNHKYRPSGVATRAKRDVAIRSAYKRMLASKDKGGFIKKIVVHQAQDE